MSSSKLFVAGSIHQGQERFSDISRGRQCSFMSFSALLCAQTLSIESWTDAIVDQILFEGDKMYLNAFERRIIPDTDTLSLMYLPDRAYPLPIDAERNSLPIEVTTTSNQSSPIEAKTSTKQSPSEAENNNQTPIRVSNTDLPIVVEPNEAQIETNNPLWLIKYKELYQGRITREEHENEAPYFTLHSALMNAFSDNNYAFIILEDYTMALIKTRGCIYMFDSHAIVLVCLIQMELLLL